MEKLKLNEELYLIQETEGVYYLMNAINKNIYTLNEIGYFIVNNINNKSKKEMINLLLDEIKIEDNSQVEKIILECEEYVEQLIDMSIISYG